MSGTSSGIAYNTTGPNDWIANGSNVGGNDIAPEKRNGFWNLAEGVGNGFWEGAKSTVSFVKSLGTKKGWDDLGRGFSDLAAMANPHDAYGFLLRVQTGNNIKNYINNIPNMSHYEMGQAFGYSAEKLVEGVVLTRGTGFATNTMRSGLGNAMWKSSTFGRKSYLFGRYHSKWVPDGRRGILNRGLKTGVGWSSHNGRHTFRLKVGGKKWFDIYK